LYLLQPKAQYSFSRTRSKENQKKAAKQADGCFRYTGKKTGKGWLNTPSLPRRTMAAAETKIKVNGEASKFFSEA
jgi:hypothetical protein